MGGCSVASYSCGQIELKLSAMDNCEFGVAMLIPRQFSKLPPGRTDIFGKNCLKTVGGSKTKHQMYCSYVGTITIIPNVQGLQVQP